MKCPEVHLATQNEQLPKETPCIRVINQCQFQCSPRSICQRKKHLTHRHSTHSTQLGITFVWVTIKISINFINDYVENFYSNN